MTLHITEPYLWFPINKENPQVKLHFYVDGVKIQEADMQLKSKAGQETDFFVSMDVSEYLGQEIEIKPEMQKAQEEASKEQEVEDVIEKEIGSMISCHDKPVQNDYSYRPKLHFTPEIGWHNDPNGLIYADGLYHMYYQWNPYGVIWGNMHWGHAVSRDLLHFKHMPMVLAPNEHGTVYSGCGFEDKEGVAGFGKNALLFYYTASGGANKWSVDAGNLHTQRLAVSTDGGRTLVRSDKFLLENRKGENRDPKVFYHEESGAYIMALYLDGDEFAIFRSNDLLHFEESQRFHAKGMWECPDLFCLSVENSEEKKWVFWSADGYYMVGNFDGYRFTPESEVQMAYATRLPYAAQTYAGISDRVISVAWLRLKNDRGNYRGVMALPAELSLVKDKKGYHIKFCPVKELEELKELNQKQEVYLAGSISFQGVPAEVKVSWDEKAQGQTKLLLGSTTILTDFERGVIEFTNPVSYDETISVVFGRENPLSLKFIIDQEVIEFWGNDGLIYGAVETEENILSKSLLVETTAEIQKMDWCALK